MVSPSSQSLVLLGSHHNGPITRTTVKQHRNTNHNMAEIRKLVILGASFGGLGVFHYLARHVLPQLKGPKYEIHLVDESSRFWWHIAAPRQIVTMKELNIDKTFIPIADIINQYPDLKDSIIFHQGSATALDTEGRTVTILKQGDESETLNYYALVIATGIKSPTPLTTFHGDYTVSQKALEDMNAKLGSAREIVISGGGPVGVETAGEIGFHLKGKAKITLITGGDKLLPVFNQTRAIKAQKLLEKVGVTVLYGVKVDSTEQSVDGPTSISLDNGKKISADIYIPAFGVTPNSQFVPDDLKAGNGYINTNKETMRVDAAGPRVYAAGDIAGVDAGGIMNMQVFLCEILNESC